MPRMKNSELLIAVAVAKNGKLSAKKAIKVWPPHMPVFIKRIQWESLFKWVTFFLLLNAL
jgi:uncharacterized membrane protein